jgi:hypothetical protein
LNVSSASPASCYGPLGETEHVRALGVFGAASTLVGRKFAIGINLFLESVQECLAGWSGTGASVSSATPRDLGRDSPVDVLRRDVASPPLAAHVLCLSQRLCTRVYVQTHA